MENKRIIEILNLVLVYLEEMANTPKMPILTSGICSVISRLYYYGFNITEKEKDFMRAFIMANKPCDQRFSRFMEDKHWTGNTFWWLPISQDKLTIPIRIKYVKALIFSISNNK